MIDFWDIDFDNENELMNDDFIEGLIRMGFTKKTQTLYVKEVVNLHGEVIKDGVFVDLSDGKIVYTPEPNCTVQMEISDTDIEKIDIFLRNNII
jgi:hypothetical protein